MLLDTCALIWLIHGEAMASGAIDALEERARVGQLLVSPVSGWEVGLLATRPRRPLQFLPTPDVWFERVLVRPGVRRADLSIEIGLAAAFLPGRLHRDPADRLLVAQARALDVPIVTRDRRILTYADQGHVKAIGC